MAWIESSTSRDNSDAEKQLQEQRRLAEQKEKSRPPESEQDAKLKMGLWVLVGDFKWKMAGQATEWKTRLQTMKDKEWFLNSLSPENLWGYSWLINGVKDSIQAWEMKFDTAKTNSALKTDIVEAYSELLNRRLIVLPKLEYMLQSWQRWEDIRNDASMRQFFITPEGEYMLALARGENPKDTEATYTLAKARELKKYIPKGELYAQSLYEQLKGTKYESIANQEKMNIAETALKKYISEVGNELLGTDSLAIMAISGPVWWTLAKAIQWERAVAITQNSINAVNKSGIAKTFVPWVRALGKETTDTVMMKLGKWTLNIAVDAIKIGTYTETVRLLGWNDAAKYASYIFLFIPWAKMAFERDMLARPTSHITSETILSWALAKIWPDRLKQFFQSQGAWVEANTSQVATGAEQAVQEIQELAKTTTINTGTTETGKQAIEKWWEKVVEVVKKTQERIGQQVDIKWLKEPTNTPQEKVVHPSETLVNYRTLYEDPEYTFLAWEKYQKLREVFPNLSHKDIIGEWQNGIILKHPDATKVIKIEKPNGDKLEKEFENQVKFSQKLDKLKQAFKDNPAFAYLQNFKIPQIQELDWMKWVYEMEKVDGIALKTFVTIQHYSEVLRDLPQWWYKWMTDNEVDIFLKARWLRTYPKNGTEMDKRWMDDADRHFIVDLESEWTKMMRTNDIDKVLQLLRTEWYDHGDAHWWNVMQTSDWYYLIDFWRSKIK